MKRNAVRLAPALVAVLAGAAVLSGCAPAANPSHGQSHHAASGGSSSGSSTAPSATPTPTPTPFPQSLGPLPANALFRITAKGVQPNGATVDLVQTVFAPTAPNAADTALLNAQCNFSGSPTWQSQFSGPVVYLDTTFTATIDPTTPTFNTKASIASYFDLGTAAFSGDFQVAQAACAPGYMGVPGTQHGVAVEPASDPVHSDWGWANPNSGFGFYGDANATGEVDGPVGITVVQDCAVQLSAAALAAAPALAAWQSQPYVKSNSCSYKP